MEHGPLRAGPNKGDRRESFRSPVPLLFKGHAAFGVNTDLELVPFFDLSLENQ